MARPISQLTKLIVSFPRTMPVSEVISRVKAKGMTTSPSNVHHVRAKYAKGLPASAGKSAAPAKKAAPAAKKAAPAKAAPKEAPKAAAAPAAKKGGSVADFIRTMPNAKASEIVAAAKKAGLSTTSKYVYRIRALDNATRKAGRAAPRPVGRPAAAPRAAAATNGHGGSDVAFRRMVLDLGVGRAKALIADVERRLSAIVAGLDRLLSRASRFDGSPSWRARHDARNRPPDDRTWRCAPRCTAVSHRQPSVWGSARHARLGGDRPTSLDAGRASPSRLGEARPASTRRNASWSRVRPVIERALRLGAAPRRRR